MAPLESGETWGGTENVVLASLPPFPSGRLKLDLEYPPQNKKKKKTDFIPYRDSVLTWLLRENLGEHAPIPWSLGSDFHFGLCPAPCREINISQPQSLALCGQVLRNPGRASWFVVQPFWKTWGEGGETKAGLEAQDGPWDPQNTCSGIHCSG